MKPIMVMAGPNARFAFRFTPAVVKAFVPRGVVGCYVLMVCDRPIYVGRSDNCLQRRLSAHGLLGLATHFLWEPCRSNVAAFYLESAWYHHLRNTEGENLLNAFHPRSPLGTKRVCPFCTPGDGDALAFALKRQRS